MVRVFSFSGEVVLNRTEALSLEELSKEVAAAVGAHCRLIRRDGSELTGPSSALIEEEEELTCVVSSVEPWLKMLGLLHEDGTAFSESWLFKQRMWWEVGGTDDLLRHRMGKRTLSEAMTLRSLVELRRANPISREEKAVLLATPEAVEKEAEDVLRNLKVLEFEPQEVHLQLGYDSWRGNRRILEKIAGPCSLLPIQVWSVHLMWGPGAGRGYSSGVPDRHAKWRAKLGRDFLLAIEQKNASLVKACLEQKAEPGVVDVPSGRSALHLAVATGDVEVMSEVLHSCVRSNVDLTVEDGENKTPLDEALEVRQSLHTSGEVIIPLLAAGKDPDVNSLNNGSVQWSSWPGKSRRRRSSSPSSKAPRRNGARHCRRCWIAVLFQPLSRKSAPSRSCWRFYCEYCDMFLTHSGLTGRRQHLTGRRHINNKIEYYQMLIREKGLTPPIYPPPPGMVLPMPKLPATAAPKPAAALPGLGLPGMLPTMPKLPGVGVGAGIPGLPTLPGMPGLLPGMPKMPGARP
eukprot:g2827.t1